MYCVINMTKEEYKTLYLLYKEITPKIEHRITQALMERVVEEMAKHKENFPNA